MENPLFLKGRLPLALPPIPPFYFSFFPPLHSLLSFFCPFPSPEERGKTDPLCSHPGKGNTCSALMRLRRERVPESSGGYDLPRVFGLALLGACFAKGSEQWSKPRSRDPAAVARPRLWFWDHVSAWGRIRAGTWPRGHVSARGRTCAGTFPRGDRCAWALICAARSEREKTLGAVLGEQGTVRRSRGRCGDDSCTLRL